MSPDHQGAIGSAAEIVEQGMLYYQGWLFFFSTHEPAEDWRRVTAPALVLFGGLDQQVPEELNTDGLKSATAGSAATVTIRSFPTANHLFQDAMTGAFTEYGTLPDAFIADFIPAISDWILQLRSE
jgi:hypothetical protein